MTQYDLYGLSGSPYSVKIRAVLRYRRLSFVWRCSMPHLTGAPLKTDLPLIPVLSEYGAKTGVVDSTKIIELLEERHKPRSIMPTASGLYYVSKLIEDFADEWLVKPMFYYRWGNRESAEFAKYWVGVEALGADEPVGSLMHAEQITKFAERQMGRMDFVGSGLANASVLEAQYKSILALMREMLKVQRFCLGSRPSAADFGLYGPLRQLGLDVSPRDVMVAAAPEVLVWLDKLDDASGEADGEWVAEDKLVSSPWFRDLLSFMGAGYGRFMDANLHAFEAGKETVSVTIDETDFVQPTFRYHAKCWRVLGALYKDQSAGMTEALKSLLQETGCVGAAQ